MADGIWHWIPRLFQWLRSFTSDPNPEGIVRSGGEEIHHLIFFVHGDPQVRPKYLDKLGGIPGAELVFVNAGGYSSAYQQLGRKLRNDDGDILPRLIAQYATAGRDYDTVSFVSFSAGYALVREVLKSMNDKRQIAAYVAIDSIHDDMGFSQTAPFVQLAKDAAEGRCLFWLGHSDVTTPQTGKGVFASTTQMASYLKGKVAPGGSWKVQAFNVRKDPREEHIAALNEWGPQFVADALVPHLGGSVRPSDLPPTGMTTMPEWLNPALSYGQRCVLLSIAEMAEGVKEEPPGSNTGKRIKEYLAGCMRNGKPLGLTAGAWCAAAACWVADRCRQRGELPPHHWRAGGIEMEQDAMTKHAWVDADVVRNGGAEVAVGDIAMFSRGAISWQRHVTRVYSVPGADGKFRTIGGNENDRWQITDRNLNSAELLGFIRYG